MQVLPLERSHDSPAQNVPYRNHSLSRLSPGQTLDFSVSSNAGQSRQFPVPEAAPDEMQCQPCLFRQKPEIAQLIAAGLE